MCDGGDSIDIFLDVCVSARNSVIGDAIGLSKAERPRWHDLRHSYATALLNKRGADYTEAMELLGHADMSTTMMYKHIIRNPEKEKAIANDVDDYYDDLPSDGDPDNVVPFRKAG